MLSDFKERQEKIIRSWLLMEKMLEGVDGVEEKEVISIEK